MKILTIGASPYLLVRNGRMHADIIESLVSDGHDVSSAVWHHDEGYFMPTESGEHLYEKDGKIICNLHPFITQSTEASAFIYELMKKVQPQIIVTVGDYKDTNFIFAIKAMYPTLFKWIAIYTFDCQGISQSSKDAFELTDYIISTSEFGWKEITSFANVKGEFYPYGPDHQKFNYNPEAERRFLLCSARNAQSSNLPAFIKASSQQPIESVIHTNLYDPGDYNLDFLKAKYNASSLSLPLEYCSIKEGISEEKMANLYNSAVVIVDCSLKSATGLSLLEGMLCGSIPVGPSYGRVGEILSLMPEEFRFFVPYSIFVGQNEEEFAIVSPEGLSSVFAEILGKIGNVSYRDAASKAAIAVAKKFSNKTFIDNLKSVIETTSHSGQTLVLDLL